MLLAKSHGILWFTLVNNNNLHRYGLQNFRQMVRVGSADTMNILLQMDEFGEKKILRFLIDQNNAHVVETQQNVPTCMSGTPENLFDFCSWGIKGYTAQKNVLVLWNHGAGIKDPHMWGRMLAKWRDEFWFFNTMTGLFELDRSYHNAKTLHEHLQQFETEEQENKRLLQERGIAFNDTTHTYLTNEDLKCSLESTCKDLLGGKKLDVLVMDACLMAMVEVATQVKTVARFLVASEEIEPGTGYNYTSVLDPLAKKDLSPTEMAKNIVACYDQEYCDTMSDYTQSAIDLAYCDDLEKNINDVALRLVELISRDEKQTIKTLRSIRLNTGLTVEFLDTDYIDLYCFYQSLTGKCAENIKNLAKGTSPSAQLTAVRLAWEGVQKLLRSGLSIIDTMVIANAVGKNMSQAHGLSIYFPTGSIHSSYYKTEFAKTNTWLHFLEKYLSFRTMSGELEV